MRCSGCGAENRPGRKFCAGCGRPLRVMCPNCAAANQPGDRFCGDCGALLTEPGPAPAGACAPVAERRLVSVLFADLVGFTTLSEGRDPDDVRALLSTYFERCRAVIERYGGIVEKFIGDAVMAVWGTPVAREDDAERAVRAALDLTQAVTALGAELGTPELRARAGVMTGNAAVEVGAEAEGMVLGDTVNTASRLQSIAAPGTVLVDDVTRRASEAAIAYEDAGIQMVRGREQPVHAWTALRVVAGAGGARRGAGLEAPFVGRDQELQLIIEASETSAAEGHAQLVMVLGDAGVGKSRLLWEFFKHLDGIEDGRYWHQGRCLSYGDGVAFWALAEIVRARAGIVEDEDPAAAREKLHAAVELYVHDARERRLVEPRLAHLIGLEQRIAPDRADLFSGWRLFFERMAQANPVILVFEDLQWADSGLLDFIDYLLEWASDSPIFILALGRPELLADRPAWPRAISLAPLPEEAMRELLCGLVPGLPDALAGQIRQRADGVPLYAMETVRMLLDRRLVAQEGARYVVTGDVAALEVPETLQALVAARLDNLETAERTLLQDAAVIGQSFTPATLTAIVARPASDVRRLLDGLVAKQILSYIDDPRSADRGQFIFLQALVRNVALSTLPRRERKARHLAVAHQIQESWGEEAGELAEVLASHYLEAVALDPAAADVPVIRASACQTLAEAGRRAISLALGPEARRHYEQAAELAEEPAARGRLLREAGLAAQLTGALDEALALLSRAAELLTAGGVPREAARVDGLAGDVLKEAGRLDEASERLARAYATVDDGSDDEAVADLAERRAGVESMRGNDEQALALADTALRIADERRLDAILVGSLIVKGIVLAEAGRPGESTALLRHAASRAFELDLASHAISAYFNLAENMMGAARFADAEELLARGLALARERGDRQGERRLRAQALVAQIVLGRWDQAIEEIESLRAHGDDIWTRQGIVILPLVLAARGDLDGLRDLRDPLAAAVGWTDVETLAQCGRGVILRETGNLEDAVAATRAAVEQLLTSGLSHVPLVFGEAVETAFTAGLGPVVRELLEQVGELKPAQLIPMLEAEAARAEARLSMADGDLAAAERWFHRAIDGFQAMDTPFALARARLQFAELLSGDGSRGAESALLRELAAAAFERLGAAPWLERARA